MLPWPILVHIYWLLSHKSDFSVSKSEYAVSCFTENKPDEITNKISDLSKKGYQLIKENDIPGAKKAFNEILDIEENNNYALVGLGDTERKLNHFNDAISYYLKCLEFYPANNYALFGLADCYKALNQYA